MDAYFPTMLNVTGQTCIVIGGGSVASRRIAMLLAAGAQVVAISPEFTDDLNELIMQGQIEGRRKGYEAEDIGQGYLILAATNDPDINLRVYEDAKSAQKLVNLADRPDLSSFLIPAIVRRGKLHMAVSTVGASPLVSVRIRDELAAKYGPEYEEYLDLLYDFRKEVRKQIKSPEQRRRLLHWIAGTDLLAWIRSGKQASLQNQLMTGLAEDLKGQIQNLFSAMMYSDSLKGDQNADDRGGNKEERAGVDANRTGG